MSQVKLTKAQLAVIDAVIAVSEEKGLSTSAPITTDSFITGILQTVLQVTQVTPTLLQATMGGTQVHSSSALIEKLVAERKKH